MSALAETNDGRHDFDFLPGSWRVQNRWLMKRLAGCEDWATFESTCVCRHILGGLGNEDEFRTDYWPGFVGMSFRFFDPQKEEWSIYWADTRTGVLQPPVFGSFSDGKGVFKGVDEFDGKPIDVRYIWSNISATTARWEQAFSPDGGQTWETNWIMDFAR